jgi:hypothetical protein
MNAPIREYQPNTCLMMIQAIETKNTLTELAKFLSEVNHVAKETQHSSRFLVDHLVWASAQISEISGRL